MLLVHDSSPDNSDLFQAVLTMVDPQVTLTIAAVAPQDHEPSNGYGLVQQDQERSRRLGRELTVHPMENGTGLEIVQLAQKENYDLIILPVPNEPPSGEVSRVDARANFVLENAHCRVCLAASPQVPRDVEQ